MRKLLKSRNRLSWTQVWDLHHWNGWEETGQTFSRNNADPALGWGTELSLVFSMVSVDAQGILSQLIMHREELEPQLPMTFSCMLPSKTWQQLLKLHPTASLRTAWYSTPSSVDFFIHCDISMQLWYKCPWKIYLGLTLKILNKISPYVWTDPWNKPWANIFLHD